MMNSLYTIVAVLVAVALIGSIGASLQQQASALNLDWKEFKMLTNDFEKNVINALREGSSPTDMREVLSDYIVNVNRILGPDTLPDPVLALIQNYERDVTTIFDQSPPEPDKQIKDFRATTHDFVKAVLDEVNPSL